MSPRCQLRAQLWIAVYAARIHGVSKEVASQEADSSLLEFDKRFKDPTADYLKSLADKHVPKTDTP